MAIYVYAPVLYKNTRELIERLGAKRLVRHDGMHFLHKGRAHKFQPKDVVVCWGSFAPPIPEVLMLNASVIYPTQLALNQKLCRIRHNLRYFSPDLIAMSHIAPNTILFNDKNWGPVTACSDFPGYATPNYRGHTKEFHIHVFENTVIKAYVKATNLPIPEYEEDYKPGKYAHPWYRTEATGWIKTPVNLKDAPFYSDMITFVNKLELNFAKVLVLADNDTPSRPTFNGPAIMKVTTGYDLEPEDLDLYVENIQRFIRDGV